MTYYVEILEDPEMEEYLARCIVEPEELAPKPRRRIIMHQLPQRKQRVDLRHLYGTKLAGN